jgi:hypothetical protein
MRTLSVIGIVGVLILLAPACESDPTGPSRGRVNVFLTDAPIDLTDVLAVNVVVTEITLFGEDGDAEGGAVPVALTSGDVPLNLLEFRDGSVVLIGTADVTPGAYKRIRLGIGSATLVRDDDGDETTPGVEEPIEVPSSKVDVPIAFAVSKGEDVDVTLDFDAQASVQVNSTSGQPQYLLRPVITPVKARAR